MEVPTFVLAVLGVVMSAFALGWNVYEYRLSGGRLKAAAVVVWKYRGDAFAIPISADPLGRPLSADPWLPFLGVTVQNVGRLPVSVTSIHFKFESGIAFMPTAQEGAALPRRLEPGDEDTWCVPWQTVWGAAHVKKDDLRGEIVATAVGVGAKADAASAESVESINERIVDAMRET